MTIVAFACIHNAGLSQMAAAFFDQFAGASHARATSGGPHPRRRIYPVVEEAMREVGVDLSGARPRYLSHEVAESAQVLVAIDCGAECPFVPGLRRIEWSFDDPKDQPLEIVRRIRDEVVERVRQLIDSEGWKT
jgi:arsenate reductase